MLPDPGCYEERDRVTGRDAMGLAAGLLAIGLGFLWHTQAIFLVIGVVLTAVTVFALARRQLTFRADHAGVLVAGEPDKLTTRRGPGVLIPWADVEQIILYSSEPGEQAPVQRIAIRRRIGAMEARKVTGWRLDRGRLAAVTATAAPDVRIAGATGKPGPRLDGPGQAANTSGLGPIRLRRLAHAIRRCRSQLTPVTARTVREWHPPVRAGSAWPLVPDRRECRDSDAQGRVPLTAEGHPDTAGHPGPEFSPLEYIGGLDAVGCPRPLETRETGGHLRNDALIAG